MHAHSSPAVYLDAAQRAATVARSLHLALAATAGSHAHARAALAAGDERAAYTLDHLADLEDTIRDCLLEHADELAGTPRPEDVADWLSERGEICRERDDEPSSSSTEAEARFCARQVSACLRQVLGLAIGRHHAVRELVARGEHQAAWIEAQLGHLAEEVRDLTRRLDAALSGHDPQALADWLRDRHEHEVVSSIVPRLPQPPGEPPPEPDTVGPAGSRAQQVLGVLAGLVDALAEALAGVCGEPWTKGLPVDELGALEHLAAETARLARDLRSVGGPK